MYIGPSEYVGVWWSYQPGKPAWWNLWMTWTDIVADRCTWKRFLILFVLPGLGQWPSDASGSSTMNLRGYFGFGDYLVNILKLCYQDLDDYVLPQSFLGTPTYSVGILLVHLGIVVATHQQSSSIFICSDCMVIDIMIWLCVDVAMNL